MATDGLTLHLSTGSYHAPPSNAGSNPLAQGSEYHLGPDLGIFGVEFSPDLGLPNFDDHFDPARNPLVVGLVNSQLSVVHAACPGATHPLNVRINIEGVCYAVPVPFASTIRGKNGARVYWRTTRGSRGSFRHFRRPVAVF
jgi:hypothetical protein